MQWKSIMPGIIWIMSAVFYKLLQLFLVCDLFSIYMESYSPFHEITTLDIFKILSPEVCKYSSSVDIILWVLFYSIVVRFIYCQIQFHKQSRIYKWISLSPLRSAFCMQYADISIFKRRCTWNEYKVPKLIHISRGERKGDESFVTILPFAYLMFY